MIHSAIADLISFRLRARLWHIAIVFTAIKYAALFTGVFRRRAESDMFGESIKFVLGRHGTI